MKALRIPLGVWTWRGTALVLVLMLAPLLADHDAGIRIAVLCRADLRASRSSMFRVDELYRPGAAVPGSWPADPACVGLGAAARRGHGGAAHRPGRRRTARRHRRRGAAPGHRRREAGRSSDLSTQLHTVEARRCARTGPGCTRSTRPWPGIASAQRLMSDGLGADRIDALGAMMRAEVERLQRLVADRAPTRQPQRRPRRGHRSDRPRRTWPAAGSSSGSPSGLRAMGRADDIAEVVNVLLENAAVHGGPDAVSVAVAATSTARTSPSRSSDQGPGIPPELRERLFDWGVEPAGLARPGHRPARRRRRRPTSWAAGSSCCRPRSAPRSPCTCSPPRRR